MNREHWDTIYGRRAASELSWYQPAAEQSLALIRRTATGHAEPIIDVGGGASVLVDDLLADGYADVTVLDLSASALRASRERLGHIAERVKWLEGDVLGAALADNAYAVWHDRAVFHFLTRPEDRARYVAQVRRVMQPGGYVIVATFAADGPTRCSGLDVARYSAEALHEEFGTGFDLITHEREEHRTPSGALQAFTYCLFRWEDGPVNTG